MYTAELERHKKEKEEWKRKAQVLADQASALQVPRLIREASSESQPLIHMSCC